MINRTKPPEFCFVVCFAALVILLLCGMRISAEAAADKTPHIQIIAPSDYAWVTEEQMYLAGTVIGEDVQSVTIKGVAEVVNGIKVEGGGFGALIKLKKGTNTIEIGSGNLTATVRVFYGAGKDTPINYRRYYVHAGTTDMVCKECHRFRNGKFDFSRNIPARSDCTSAKCHANAKANMEYVHGPVGAGVCISCHNPHGSFYRNQLARSDRELCMVCHQAKQEEFSKKVIHPPVEEGCTTCHDPHQSPVRFQLKEEKGEPVSTLCFECHDPEIFSKRYQHGPVGAGDCIACHNTHASDNEKLLIAPKKDGQLCFQCHSDRKDSFNLKEVHAPVREDCSKCHDPHSSEHKMQLYKEENELCRDCHAKQNPQMFEEMLSAPFQHQPVSEGRCVACHRPHSSNYQPLLVDSLEKLCFQCHSELGYEVNESRYRHGPVKTGDCTSCHSKIHGSPYVKLLGREFPMNFYAAYSPEKYDLCFSCHNKDIAKQKTTDKLTNFRDGEYNLHFLHINRKKGRTCTACHGAHASGQAKHVRKEVPFGSWAYPIDYTQTENGGTCVVGCHAPKTYDRIKPLLHLNAK